MTPIEKRNLLLGAACVSAGTAAAFASKGGMGFGRQPMQRSPRELIRQKRLPNVTLLAHTGETLRLYDDLFKGKKVVINFMYTVCRNICLPSTRNIKEARLLLGDFAKDIHFYSISLTPRTDTPATLVKYMKANEVPDGWTYLTGTSKSIDSVRRSLGFASGEQDEDADLANHLGMLRIVNEPMVSWGHSSTLSSGRAIARMIRYELG